VAGVCDLCKGSLYQRSDDTEETVLNRLEVFKKQTRSLIDYYEKKKVLVRIDAGKKKEDTQAEIVSMLKVPARSS
jgi:adenylate kinase